MQSLKSLQERIVKDPNDPEAHWKMGCILGYLNRWDEAWPELEWRMKGHRNSIVRRTCYPKPDWYGESGKVLIYQDQGFGDFIMWIRYAQLIPKTVLEVSPELYSLMKFQNLEVVVQGNQLPEYDYVIPATSLPSRFDSVFDPVGYFHSPKTGRFHKGRNMVGIAWAGNPGHPDDKIRSATADDFTKLLKPNREVVSLMVSQSDKRFTDYSLKLIDFADTAEMISNCDVIVSVDTAVAHLAGALGKEVHLVLAYEHDWRWGSEEKTPWYPTMKIWRKEKNENWDTILSRISDAIG